MDMTDQQSKKNFETQLDELGAEIRDLLHKIETGVDKEVEALRPKLKAAQERFEELRQTSIEAWGDLKPGLEKASVELQKAFKEAAARFTKNKNPNS